MSPRRAAVYLSTFYVVLFAALAVPAVVLAQESFDPSAIVQALPLSTGTRALLLMAWPIVYAVAAVARGFIPPHTIVGRALRFVLDGVRHPQEKAADEASEQIAANIAAGG